MHPKSEANREASANPLAWFEGSFSAYVGEDIGTKELARAECSLSYKLCQAAHVIPVPRTQQGNLPQHKKFAHSTLRHFSIHYQQFAARHVFM
jgi:hypothetical protein